MVVTRKVSEGDTIVLQSLLQFFQPVEPVEKSKRIAEVQGGTDDTEVTLVPDCVATSPGHRGNCQTAPDGAACLRSPPAPGAEPPGSGWRRSPIKFARGHCLG